MIFEKIQRFAQHLSPLSCAKNVLEEASELSGRRAHSLEDIKVIAAATRTALSPTAKVYGQLLYATSNLDVTKGEVARATANVNRLCRASGASTSKQMQSVIHLAHALLSGVLKVDELKAIISNTPLLAQAIADEFGTTIGKLKEPAMKNKLVSRRVFNAILPKLTHTT